jgi:MFS family permease
MLTVILYVQHTLQLSPAKGSLLFPAFNLAVIGGSLAGPRLIARAGVQTLLLGGFTAVVGGIALLLALPGQGVPVLRLLTAFAVMGAGLGCASVASTTAGTAAVRSTERGVGAGLLNSTAQLGQALGLAAITPVVASAAPMTGYRLGFVLAAGVAVVGAVAAAVTVSGRPASASPTPEPTDAPSRSRY